MKVQLPGAGSDQPENPLCGLYQINPAESCKSAEDSPLHFSNTKHGRSPLQAALPSDACEGTGKLGWACRRAVGALAGAAVQEVVFFTPLLPWLRAWAC